MYQLTNKNFKPIVLIIALTTTVINCQSYEHDAIMVQSPPNHILKRPENILPTFIVLHYTECTLAQTLQIFSGKTVPTVPVCSHYTISQEGILFQHAAEGDAARHAGASYWHNFENINFYSIGIEHVNLGFRHNDQENEGTIIPGDTRQWYYFDAKQIEKSIQLCASLIKKYNISPRNIVGHSDIAPQRKDDPGPLFPWKQYADAGIGAWPNPAKSWDMSCYLHAKKHHTMDQWLLQHLHIWGYQKPTDLVSPHDIIKAFQMHFRQRLIDGLCDGQTCKILNDLFLEYILGDHHHTCPCESDKN